jgi:aldose sugar dehydrogenase
MTHYPLTGTTAALSLLWFAPSPAIAQQLIDSDKHQIRTDKIGETLEHPWGLALMPDGRFLVTERNSGRLLLGTRLQHAVTTCG